MLLVKTAVIDMPCALTLKAVLSAHVSQDTLGMDSYAIVRICLCVILFMASAWYYHTVTPSACRNALKVIDSMWTSLSSYSNYLLNKYEL